MTEHNAASLPFDLVKPDHTLDESLAAQRELRQTCPVSVQRFGNTSAVFVVSYEECSKVYRDKSRFSNRHGHELDLDRPMYDDPMMTANVFFMDPPEQVPIRRILMTALNPSTVEAATPYIRDVTAQVVGALPDSGPIELNEQWARQIPSRVITHMIGVPETDYAQFSRWTHEKAVAHGKHGRGEEVGEELVRVEQQFQSYMREQMRLRRSGEVVTDDLITRMIALSDADDHQLTDDQIIANSIFALNAGNSTTAHLMMNLIYQLISNGLYQQVRENPELLEGAIEESLRLTPPIQFSMRQADEDVELGGMHVAQGQMVVMSNMSADRDESVWGDDAESFDPTREHPARHLGFGLGNHACLGAPLARRVARIAIGALLERYPKLEFAEGFEYKNQELWTSLGPDRLDVVASS